MPIPACAPHAIRQMIRREPVPPPRPCSRRGSRFHAATLAPGSASTRTPRDSCTRGARIPSIPVPVHNRLHVGRDFLLEKLPRRPRNLAVLRRQVLRCEDLGRLLILDQKCPAHAPYLFAFQFFDRFDRCCRHSDQSLSKIPAAPWPPPTHIVTIPYRDALRRISRRIVAVSFAPVQPSG